jgi:hypothetical protein
MEIVIGIMAKIDMMEAIMVVADITVASFAQSLSDLLTAIYFKPVHRP